MQLNFDMVYLPERIDVIILHSYVCCIDILKIDLGVWDIEVFLSKFIKPLPR